MVRIQSKETECVYAGRIRNNGGADVDAAAAREIVNCFPLRNGAVKKGVGWFVASCAAAGGRRVVYEGANLKREFFSQFQRYD